MFDCFYPIILVMKLVLVTRGWNENATFFFAPLRLLREQLRRGLCDSHPCHHLYSPQTTRQLVLNVKPTSFLGGRGRRRQIPLPVLQTINPPPSIQEARADGWLFRSPKRSLHLHCWEGFFCFLPPQCMRISPFSRDLTRDCAFLNRVLSLFMVGRWLDSNQLFHTCKASTLPFELWGPPLQRG